MLLAEIEIRHSRAVAPTRRVALGPYWLPTEPSPGYGGILLGGIVAAHLADSGEDLREEFLGEAEDGRHARVGEPVMHVLPPLFRVDQAAAFEAGEVVGDVRLAQPGRFDNLADGTRAAPEGFENREAGGVGKAPKELGLEGCGARLRRDQHTEHHISM